MFERIRFPCLEGLMKLLMDQGMREGKTRSFLIMVLEEAIADVIERYMRLQTIHKTAPKSMGE
jgi:hypothetical protein